MVASPIPNPASPEFSDFRKADLLKDHALLLHETSTLSDLISTRPFSYEQNSFLYPILPFSRPVDVPEGLGVKVADIDFVNVTLGGGETPDKSNKNGRAPFISIDIIAGDKTIFLSRSGDGENLNETDWAYVQSDSDEYDAVSDQNILHGSSDLDTAIIPGMTALTKLTNGEINKLVMSLAALEIPIEQDNAYNDIALFSPKFYEMLRDALHEKAFQTNELRKYMLSDGETEIALTREDDQLDAFTVNYFDHKRNQAISVQCQLQPFDLKFFTFGFNPGSGHKLQLIPTIGEISDVRTLIRNEIELIAPGTLSGETDEEKPKNELDEDSFNPPNPSAA